MFRLLFLTLLPSLVWANPNEMLSDKELERKFVTLIKEKEIEDLIKETKDFKKCRDMNQYAESDTADVREGKIKKAQECFQQEIANKNTKAIQELSDNLGLESYQLVKSKNIKDITSYLGARMRKALTGVDDEDQKAKVKLANIKFQDKQLVNQDEFFKLYSYQLTKNALLEVSRYCFENFTNTTPNVPTGSFMSHWENFFSQKNNPSVPVSDTGKHTWGNFTAVDDPSKAYNQIFDGIGRVDPPQLQRFWDFCTKKMKEMCDNYQPASGNSVGANSCLTINRLRNIRNAITSTEKTEEYIKKNMSGQSGTTVGLDNGGRAKFFVADKENSYDNLTNVSSYDLLTGNSDSDLTNLATKCQTSPEHSDCDKFIAEGSTSSEELMHKIDQEMRFKQEAEITRLLKIKKDEKANFKEFLEQNGYFELAQKENLEDTEIKEYLTKTFDAQREAVISQLKNKVGSRQVVTAAKEEQRKEAITKSAQDTAEERARLSQVILFNNIITSNLKLFDASGKELGQNVGAWKKESEALTNAKIDQNLYSNIQGVIDTSKGTGKANSITGTDFIDQIIGKKQ